jgi:hypothetical protein
MTVARAISMSATREVHHTFRSFSPAWRLCNSSSARETSIVVGIEASYFFTYFFKSFGPTSAP